MRNKTVVIGSGRLGASIASKLASQGKLVDIIDKDKIAFRKLDDDFSGNIMMGDATEMEVLEAVNPDSVQSFVIVTGDDNVNIYIAHVALTFFDIPKIYIRLFDTSKGKLIHNTRIKTIYPHNLSIDAFAKLEKGDSE
ncbi:MAG TPA: NAD(P)-binding protein [Acholeplasma sp.]|nr:NAD(P)-binding protein [Acholeplasma sp.]